MVDVKLLKSYKYYGRVVAISNGVIEAFVTVDLGPRIIRFGFVDGQNIMNANRDEFVSLTDEKYEAYFGKGKKWENFGGHRLWISPESLPDTYYPDCNPVEYEVLGNTVIFTPPAQTENGIALSMEISMSEDTSEMTVLHKGKNIGEETREFALWALSVMTAGGVEIIPQNTCDTGLLPNRSSPLFFRANI